MHRNASGHRAPRLVSPYRAPNQHSPTPPQARAPVSSSSSPQSPSSNPSNPSSSHPSLPPPFTHPLGSIPHTIRGYLSSFSTIQVEGKPYDCCSACSDRIIQLYEEDPWGFVQRALNERGWVEEVSGLAEVQRLAEEAAEGLEWDSEVEDGGVDDGEGEGELI